MRSTVESLACVLVFLTATTGIPAWAAPALDPTFGVEEVKLSAHDGVDDDAFGRSVAISGDTAVVGATGDQDHGPYTGSAYVFRRDLGGPDSWGQVKKITASDGADGDRFGNSIAISADTIVVGAPGPDGGSTGPGFAYVFQRDLGGADNWGQVKKLVASDGAALDTFGGSVVISGDTILVGADRDDDHGSNSGSVYVFQRDAGGTDYWGEVKKITASDAASGDGFGGSVAIFGDTAVVGAPFNDDLGTNSGSVYVLRRDVGGIGNWGEVTKLTASDGVGGDDFGLAVAIWDDTVAVGTISSGDGYRSGSAYVFQRDHGGADSWGEVAELTASDAAASDHFGGSSVAIWGDRVVVGASGNEDHGSNSGSTYLFHRHEGGVDSWGEVTKLTASGATVDDYFGQSVSAWGDHVLVGAPEVNTSTGPGSAYVYFSFPTGDPGTPFCFGDGSGLRCPCLNDATGDQRGCANSTGDGCQLLGWGSNSLAQQTVDPLVLSVIGSRPSQPGLFFGGLNALNDGLGLRFGDGLRCAGGGLVRFEIVFASSNGSCSTSVPIASVMGVAPADVRRFQFWYRDPGSGSPCGNEFNLSNGYEVRFLP